MCSWLLNGLLINLVLCILLVLILGMFVVGYRCYGYRFISLLVILAILEVFKKIFGVCWKKYLGGVGWGRSPFLGPSIQTTPSS